MEMRRSAIIPQRLLYSMLRVGNLERSVSFYRDALGMKELRRETFTQARFTLVFIGYSDEETNAVIELTCNWDEANYQQGTGFGHIALEVQDIYGACERLAKLGVKILRAPGPMKMVPDKTGEAETIAFIQDPDGYKIELIEARAS